MFDQQKKFHKVIFLTDTQYIDSGEIIYIMAEGVYTKVYLKNGSFIVRKSLKEWEELLPTHTFARCSRSCIVNLEKVLSIKDNMVKLDEETVIKISRRMQEKFISRYKEYIIRIKDFTA